MILYCDSSAFIKLYIPEPHAEAVHTLAEEAAAVSICRITWAEAFAGLSRRARERPADSEAIADVKRLIAGDWSDYLVRDVGQETVELASAFAEAFALRGYDSVQLAAAREAEKTLGDSIVFACFDRRLSNAARALGMQAPFGGG